MIWTWSEHRAHADGQQRQQLPFTEHPRGPSTVQDAVLLIIAQVLSSAQQEVSSKSVLYFSGSVIGSKAAYSDGGSQVSAPGRRG